MMDYRKRFRSLVIVDAVLLLLVALGILFSPRMSDSRSSRRTLLAGPDAVSKITITGSSTLELAKSGTGWIMASADGSLPADAARIGSFLEAVGAIVSMETVAKDKASWPSLGLDGDAGRRVTLTGGDGSVLADFILGSYAQSLGAVYMALANGTEAYSVASGMASYILGSRASWLDLRAWTAPPTADAVQQVSIRGTIDGPAGVAVPLSYTATRSSANWLTDDGVALDTAKVEAAIRALASLRGEDYAPASESAGASMVTVEVRLGNGRSLSLSVEPKRADGRYPAASSQRDRRLYLPGWAVSEALKPLDALKTAAP